MAILTLNMREEIEKLADAIEKFDKKQLPFAKARALWFTALEAKKSLPPIMNKVFTIRKNRSNPWPLRRIRIFPGGMREIKQAGANEVTIGSKDMFGAMLSLGGTRYRKDGKKMPVPILGGARKNKLTIIKKGRNDLDAIMAKPQAFAIKPKNNPGQHLIVMRRRKYKKGEERWIGAKHNKTSPVTLMFSLKTQTTIKPMWRLDEILGKTLRAELPRKFVDACKFAMKSAK